MNLAIVLLGASQRQSLQLQELPQQQIFEIK